MDEKEKNDILKLWEKIVLNSELDARGNEYFTLYDANIAASISKAGSYYLSQYDGSFDLKEEKENKFERRKRIIKKLLDENLDN